MVAQPAPGRPHPAPTHAALADCEAVRPGWLGQPVNALSSLAATAAGIAVLAAVRRQRVRRRVGAGSDQGADDPAGRMRRIAVTVAGLAIAANGPGGLAYHGPGTRSGKWLHDTAVVATLSAVAAVDIGDLLATAPNRQRPDPFGRGLLAAQVAVTGLAAAVLTRRPQLGGAAQAVLGATVAAAELAVGVRGIRPVTGPGVVIGIGALVHARSRTGCRWCRPDSILQGHALWHLLSAASLGWWGVHAAGDPVSRAGRHRARARSSAVK